MITNSILPIYGAIAGDIVGSRFEHWNEKLLDFTDYNLFEKKCHFTDDTVFTIGMAEALLRNDLSPRRIAHYMRKWGRRYPKAGFGTATKAWIFERHPKPYKSDRNGAAMRVSPCGVVATTLEESLQLAKINAEISHNTIDGIQGAQAISASIFLAKTGCSKEEIKQYAESAFSYDLSSSLEYNRSNWKGFSCKAKETVPQSIIAFLESSNVESAIRNAISLGSDADTMADMAGAIAAAYYGDIPFLDTIYSYLPKKMTAVLEELNKKIQNKPFDPLVDRHIHNTVT